MGDLTLCKGQIPEDQSGQTPCEGDRHSLLDVIAVDEAGVRYHIEIQLADNDDHILRVRFYSAMVDSELLEKGIKYKDLPKTFIFYISVNYPDPKGYGAC